MSVAAKVVTTRVSSAKRQLENIKTFVTKPVGIFETVDRMLKTFRQANRETLSALGVSASRGQILRRPISVRIPRVRRLI